MPDYHVIAEIDRLHEPARLPRGSRGPTTVSHIITANNITSATLLAGRALREQLIEDSAQKSVRIVSVEELSAFRADQITDEQIIETLVQHYDHPEDFYESFSFSYYEGLDFLSTVDEIARGLDESGLCPGLHLSMLVDHTGVADYSMIEVYDPQRGHYVSTGSEIKRLTEDREAQGRDAALSIARALLNQAQYLM